MIFFCGDVHGCFDHLAPPVRQHRPDAVILLGDIQPQHPIEDELAEIRSLTAIFFIHGNHDTDSAQEWKNLTGGELAAQNLHGRVVEVAGLRIAGLGGIFRGQAWMPSEAPRRRSYDDFVRFLPPVRRSLKAKDLAQLQAVPALAAELQDLSLVGLRLKHQSSIFPDVYDALAAQQADILVTHEGPSSHPYGFEALDTLARRMGVSRLYHGHHHDRLDYSDDAQRMGFHAFGVGFCGITDEAGNVIRPGDFDEDRHRRKEQKTRERE